jgi:hypothetical protein
LTSPQPIRPKLPRPIREGSDISIEMPDGTIIPVEPLAASLLAQEWMQVVAGALCYEKTRLRGDSNS